MSTAMVQYGRSARRAELKPKWGYDANGNMNLRAGAGIIWSSYNLPTLINHSGGNSSSFTYGAHRQRTKQVNVEGSITTTTIYVGGIFEKVTIGAATEYRHHVMGAGGAVAIHTRGGSNVTRYLLKDHLGSVDRITDASGNVLVKVSDDSFGKRRDGADWVGPPSSGDWAQIAAATRRGFTGHEHLDNVELIHMNGRVYDPALGRFIQADPFVPDPLDAQSFNRYSYVRNRPLSLIDPSGFTDDGLMHTDGGGIGDPMNLRGVRGGHVMSVEERGGHVPSRPPPRPGVAHGNLIARNQQGDACPGGAKAVIGPAGSCEKDWFAAETERAEAHVADLEASLEETTELEARYEMAAQQLEAERRGQNAKVIQVTGHVYDAATLTNPIGIVSRTLVKKGGKYVIARGLSAGARVNMPAWKKIAIDMDEVASGHMIAGSRLAPGNMKDVFPGSMSSMQVERAIRNAYRHGEVLHSQGADRVFVRGPFGSGSIEMWVNKATKTIETAWPKF